MERTDSKTGRRTASGTICRPGSGGFSGTINRRAGVTLVEAILALAILGTGIFVLIETTARCLAVIRVSRHYQTARAVLDRGELDHPLIGTNTVADNTVESHEYENGFTFSRELEAVDGEDGLYVVRTRVTWSESGRASFEEVVSLLYCPEEE